jgi:predicted RNA-binding protein with RPS1 domain
MSLQVKVIDRNRILGGYSLSVRDNWVYKIKKVHLNETEKDKYLEDFGEKIITFDEFFEWYKKLKESLKGEK